MTVTSIEWTDRVWNPTVGCDRVSAGCDHCYAIRFAHRFSGAGQKFAGLTQRTEDRIDWTGAVAIHPERLSEPLRWRKPARVFVDSMSDLFHPRVPGEFIDQVFGVMAACPHHTFQILTKRPQRMHRYLSDEATKRRIWHAGRPIVEQTLGRDMYEVVPVAGPGRGPDQCYPATWPLPNVWLGTSVEDQAVAWRVDWLVKTPAAIRFLSCEPLIGPLNLTCRPCPGGPHYDNSYCNWCCHDYDATRFGTVHPLEDGYIHWVIAGGESGPGFRPLDLDWARSLRDQCRDAGVPFFFKQVGGIRPKAGGRLLDGREWNEMPGQSR